VAKQPLSPFIGQRQTAEMASINAFDPVMPRQPLVQVRIVGSQQLLDGTILTNLTFEEQFRLLSHGFAQGRVDVRELTCIRFVRSNVSHFQPLFDEITQEPRRTAIREHAANLIRQRTRLFQPAARGDIQQLVIGNAFPQEERQPRG
jgi:hypothetical protein